MWIKETGGKKVDYQLFMSNKNRPLTITLLFSSSSSSSSLRVVERDCLLLLICFWIHQSSVSNKLTRPKGIHRSLDCRLKEALVWSTYLLCCYKFRLTGDDDERKLELSELKKTDLIRNMPLLQTTTRYKLREGTLSTRQSVRYNSFTSVY